MRLPLRVAAVQPVCTARDVVGNARVHAAAIRSARARLVVFPELSLTGYELDAAAVALDDAALLPMIEACAAAGSVALVGAPVDDGHAAIGMLRIEATGVALAYRKTWLGDAEKERFRAGNGPAVLHLDGWRLGLGICKDTGAAQHTAGTAALGVDAYVAGLVHRPEELAEQQARAVVIARTCRAFVVFASFAGPTGGVFDQTAGSSAIWSPDGIVISRTGSRAGDIVRATLT